MAIGTSSLPSVRIGQGYDLHRLTKGKKLMLGGVLIDSSTKGAIAHSDGDVLLHALIDALLGACALGDIGVHFPPSDEAFKNMSSELLLQRILPLLQSEGYRVVNVDSTVFLEAPKLSPYKTLIQDNIACLLSLPKNGVSIKAKTAEGLPPIGTTDAVAASVTVLLQVNA